MTDLTLSVGAAAILGLMIGSFLNVCIYRLPRSESIVSPASKCPACATPIRWFDNVPIVGYVLLRGRCRACGASFGARYLVIEVVTSLIFMITVAAFGLDPAVAPRLCLAAILIALFVIDLEHQILPDALTFPGIVIGIVASVWWPPGIMSSVIGVGLGAGLLLGVRAGWKAMRGVDAMGLGDVKMLAMIGAFLGWQQVLVVLFLSTLGGAVVGVGLAIAGRGTMATRLPFGTFLAVGAFASALWGDPILQWYFGWFY